MPEHEKLFHKNALSKHGKHHPMQPRGTTNGNMQGHVNCKTPSLALFNLILSRGSLPDESIRLSVLLLTRLG